MIHVLWAQGHFRSGRNKKFNQGLGQVALKFCASLFAF